LIYKELCEGSDYTTIIKYKKYKKLYKFIDIYIYNHRKDIYSEIIERNKHRKKNENPVYESLVYDASKMEKSLDASLPKDVRTLCPSSRPQTWLRIPTDRHTPLRILPPSPHERQVSRKADLFLQTLPINVK